MEHGENEISIFKDFDYAMLGDIHLENQILDKEGRIRYAGSTIQQNFGESTCKGFLLWDIKDKENFTCKPFLYTSPKPFVSVSLTADGKIPELEIPQGARVRLMVENSLSVIALKKAVDVAKKTFKPESISVINKTTFINNVEFEEGFKKENLRDLVVQEKLIREYLEDYKINKNLEKRIMELNKKYKQIVEETDETYRNTDFEILELKWDNLFNYGKGNRINFTNFTGITGIFGKNFSGKSSIVDSLLFTIYNSISKNSRKNINIINNDKTTGMGRVRIKRGTKIYTITRRMEKWLKKLKGNETVEARTIVDFECYDLVSEKNTSLNGVTRAETDRNIVKYFGTIDDFLLTSMSSQLGSLTFINEGSTKRKEILAKFLDLELFDKKFKNAKDDAAALRAQIKLLENTDYDSELKKYKEEMFSNEATTLKRKNKCECLKGDIRIANKKIKELEDKINSAPTEIINIVEIRNQIEIKQDSIQNYQEEIENKQSENQINKEKIEKANEFLKTSDADSLNNKKIQISNTEKELESLLEEIKYDSLELQRKESQAKLLGVVPCGPEFSHCKFICHAYEAKKAIPSFQESVENNNKTLGLLKNKISNLDPKNVETELKKFNHLLQLKTELENKVPSDELLVENYKSKKSIMQHELKNLERKEKLYEENKEVIEDLEGIVKDKNNLKLQLINYNSGLEDCENVLLELYKSHGYLEQRIENLEEKQINLTDHQNDYEAYDLFGKCMHPNGIAYDIIKRSLPTINSEISKILANIVDFQVYFETDDNRLDIYIQQPDRDASPLEMASGAEKTVAAMAIRLAFTNISTLPKSQIFVLDEPGTALDEERMEGFVRILDITTSVFKTVILISHLDSLKDSADSIISIEKKGGYANVVA
jgi:DNA repair exonuclease SbcCD ATPase subunit